MCPASTSRAAVPTAVPFAPFGQPRTTPAMRRSPSSRTRLTGWRIDIKSETQFAEEQRRGDEASTPVTPDATDAATPDAAPEVAAEAGGPTTEPQPGPEGGVAGEPADTGEPTPEATRERVEAAEGGAENRTDLPGGPLPTMVDTEEESAS